MTQGDLSALEEVGVHVLGDGFDTDVGRRNAHEIEWGLGQLPDGSVVIIRGEHGAVDWSRYPDVIALAHSHPTLGPDGSSKALDLKGGDSVEQILDDIGNNVALLPSSADLGFVHARGIKDHIVHTPYRYNPATKKVEAGFDKTPPTIDVHIVSTTVGSDGRIRAEVEIRSGPVLLWKGPIESMAGFTVKEGLFNRTAMPTPEDLAFLSAHTDGEHPHLTEAARLPLDTAVTLAPDVFAERLRKYYKIGSDGMTDAEIADFLANLRAYHGAVKSKGFDLPDLLAHYRAGGRFDVATKRWGSISSVNAILSLPASDFKAKIEHMFPGKVKTDADFAALRIELLNYQKHFPDGEISLQSMVDYYANGHRIDEDTGRHYDPKGEESVAATRKRLIDNFPGGKWDDVVKKAQAAFGADAKVVPVEGVYHFVDGDGEKLTFNDVIPSSTQKTLKKKLVEAYKAMGAADPEDRADTLMTTLLAGELVLVQGTPTVRATSNYDSRYKKSETGWNSLTKPEVHHMHPLFLGGSHTLDNLIALEGLSGKLHDEIHSIFNTLSVNGVGMNPNTLQSKFASSLKPGYAVVLPDGTVRLFTHDEPPTP